MLDTVNEMKQFIALQQKSLSELQAIAEGLGLPVSDNKELLIRHLLSEERPVQRDINQTTLLAITITNDESRNLMLKWRKNIFEQGKYKDFPFVSSKGEEFSQRFKRILLSVDSVRNLIRLNMIVTKDYTKDVFTALSECPDKFTTSLVLKKHQGTNWLMLCVEPKRKAA